MNKININDLIKEAMRTYMASKNVNDKNRMDTLKLVKTAFMEYVTNETNAKQFDSVDDVSVRITKISAETQEEIINEMAKIRKKNIEKYQKANRPDLVEKENNELVVLQEFLPKEATEEDIMNFLNTNYPDGIEKALMGKTIGAVKAAFESVDGKLASQCVSKILK